MSAPLRLLLLIAVCAAASGELNVWFERRMLASVVSQMLLLNANNPLRPRCKPKGSAAQLLNRLTADRYPIVAEGHRIPDLYLGSGRVLASDLNSFTLHWSTESRDGPAYRVQYKFMDLRSNNLSLLHHPKLDIPDAGFVPTAESGFRLSLECSNRTSGVADFDIHVVFQWPDRPERRSLEMQYRFSKACLSAADQRQLRHKCYCRKKCELRVRRRGSRRGRNRRPAATSRPTSSSTPERSSSGVSENRRQQRRLRRDSSTQPDSRVDVNKLGRRLQRRRKRRRRQRKQRKRCQAVCRRACRDQPSGCGA